MWCAFASGEAGILRETVDGLEATTGEQGAEERRAPVLARARTALQAVGFRQQLEQLAGALTALEPRDRRPVYEIARWIAANWIGQHGPSHRFLVVEASPSESRLRMLVYSDPELDDPRFWEQLVAGGPAELIDSWTPTELITSWEHDRRGSSGIWFDLVRPTP